MSTHIRCDQCGFEITNHLALQKHDLPDRAEPVHFCSAQCAADFHWLRSGRPAVQTVAEIKAYAELIKERQSKK